MPLETGMHRADESQKATCASAERTALHEKGSVMPASTGTAALCRPSGYPSPMPDADIEIINDEAGRRWQAFTDGELAGYSEYVLAPGRIVFTHTVVEPRFEGRGIGTRLARAALEDAVARDLRIVPRCPFVRAYLRRHPEYHPRVDWPDDAQASD